MKNEFFDKLWLSPEIFKLPHGEEDIEFINHSEVYRSYEYWERSEQLLRSSESNEFDFRDAIANLKRSVDIRFKLIEKIYNLRSLEQKGCKKHYTDILANYSVIRPLIIESLFNLRNKLEHADADPPLKDRVLDYVDVVWYFLKSTDGICKTKVLSIGWDDFEGKNHFEIKYEDISSLLITINGNISNQYLSKKSIDDWFCLDIIKLNVTYNDNFCLDGDVLICTELARILVRIMLWKQ